MFGRRSRLKICRLVGLGVRAPVLTFYLERIMKRIFTVILLVLVLSGCYMPMPSVGVEPTRVTYIEVCTHNPSTGKVECVYTRKWVK